MRKITTVSFCILFALTLKSQSTFFDLSAYKLFNYQINSALDTKTADYLTLTSEKTNLSVFSFVDGHSGKAYFFVEKNSDYKELGLLLKSNGCQISDFEEIPPAEDIFLEIYMNRGGISTDEIPEHMPKFIQIGPDNELSNDLYNLAKKTWVKKYPEKYNSFFPPKKEMTEEETEKYKSKIY